MAQSVLDGGLGTIEGARRLAALRLRVRAEDDPDFLVFVGIDSQTDHFPLGEERGRWDPAALARLDAERRRAEAGLRGRAEPACRGLIRKYESAG